MLPELLATFAPYLLAYSDISIKYDGTRVRPETQIEKQLEKEIVFVEEGKPPAKALAKAIRWKQSFFSKLYMW